MICFKPGLCNKDNFIFIKPAIVQLFGFSCPPLPAQANVAHFGVLIAYQQNKIRMRRLLQIILLKPILWASKKFASRPQPERIFSALSALLRHIRKYPGRKGIIIPLQPGDRYIVFSDQHRGAKNGADDFMNAEPNYLAALDYYFRNGYKFISLGDSEELWENTLTAVKKHNRPTFEAEKKFIRQKRFYKIFGNHDLYWANDFFSKRNLKGIYGQEVKVYEAVLLQLTTRNLQPETVNSLLTIFLTHGHQGDAASDGNWFSKFFVARIWAPLQAFLKINPNTPAYNEKLKTEHNHIMYRWSAQQQNPVLITGHTHQPVFESLTHMEKLLKHLAIARIKYAPEEMRALEKEIEKRKGEYKTISSDYLNMKPSYFNTGCCCFSDGDITGIEISFEKISLVKWSKQKGRELLTETALAELHRQLS